MMDMPVRLQLPHRERLGLVLDTLRTEPLISLNTATFWAKKRQGSEEGQVGCVIGHYVKRHRPKHLELVPLNFMEQVKAPILASELLHEYPAALWTHHTLHYSGPDIEAWGLTAACLFFQLRPYDCQRLFWPNGAKYKLVPDRKMIADRLEMFIAVERSSATADQ